MEVVLDICNVNKFLCITCLLLLLFHSTLNCMCVCLSVCGLVAFGEVLLSVFHLAIFAAVMSVA